MLVGSCPARFKTEAVVLRSIRYGEADRILHLYSRDAGADRTRSPRARAQAALALRRPPGAVLPARHGPARGPWRAGDRHRRRDPRRLSAAALQRPRRSAPPRAPATRCCGCSTRSSPTPPPTTCSAATCRCSTEAAAGRFAAGLDMALAVPAQAGARGRLLARARLLCALRRGRAPGRLLGGGGRSGLRELRAGRLPARPGGASVHGRRAGRAARGGAGGRRARRCARSSGR